MTSTASRGLFRAFDILEYYFMGRMGATPRVSLRHVKRTCKTLWHEGCDCSSTGACVGVATLKKATSRVSRAHCRTHTIPLYSCVAL